MANGDRLVSFERRDRIWLYPRAGGPPHPVPMPGASFPPNGGMEALAVDPEGGADAYLVGAEVSGDTWTCHLVSALCTKGPSVEKSEEFGLVAIKRLPGMHRLPSARVRSSAWQPGVATDLPLGEHGCQDGPGSADDG